jgi:enamine deaminase RidA (YjgF/YER057c/UK114 family)
MPKRKVISLPGHPKHRNPIPIGVTLGNLILPSVISGQDPRNPGANLGPEKQIEQAFINMKDIIEAAGGTTDNIGKVVVYLKDFRHREFVNREWLKMFPDEDNRPARHVMQADLQGNTAIQMDVVAAL